MESFFKVFFGRWVYYWLYFCFISLLLQCRGTKESWLFQSVADYCGN